jgi:hypothetical protein
LIHLDDADQSTETEIIKVSPGDFCAY